VDKRTQNTRIIYVCDDNKTNLAYLKERNLLYVHEKWLDFSRVHSSSECAVTLVSDGDSQGFFCDHVVEELYKRAIMAICHPIDGLRQNFPKQAESLQLLLRQSRDKIHEMPTMVQTTPVYGATSLRVSWNDGYTELSRRYMVRKLNIWLFYMVLPAWPRQKSFSISKAMIPATVPGKLSLKASVLQFLKAWIVSLVSPWSHGLRTGQFMVSLHRPCHRLIRQLSLAVQVSLSSQEFSRLNI
jgi:hypothetical protein